MLSIFNSNPQVSSEFLNYLSIYGKSYGTVEEMQYRFAIWSEKDEFIKNSNASHVVGHNKFSDMKPEEILVFSKPPRKEMEATFLDTNDIPETVNWVEAGAVNPPLT